ncbi:ribokinase [Sulfitobacter aestuarii]|uniref:Ribokinase n=1 Tax=Sulfitobacter aestuarii TaxID=2161676 RepID=A0ABW5U006_9RHOB
MIWNLGSINADNFYDLPHLPGPGETLTATRFRQGLGGKGANMSVAAARAGARVMHIGATGADGRWAAQRLFEYGVDIPHVAEVDSATGHANIHIDPQGENSIVIFAGANADIDEQMIGAALSEARPGDTLLLQNETSGQVYAAKTAKALGLRLIYAAAPFSAAAVAAILEDIDILVLNAVEAGQLHAATGRELDALPVGDVIVTLGSDGCKWISNTARTTRLFPAFPVVPVDTTGAGDTFTGYLASALDRSLPMPQAITLASRAGALMVTRRGTADVIPDLREVQDHDFG